VPLKAIRSEQTLAKIGAKRGVQGPPRATALAQRAASLVSRRGQALDGHEHNGTLATARPATPTRGPSSPSVRVVTAANRHRRRRREIWNTAATHRAPDRQNPRAFDGHAAGQLSVFRPCPRPRNPHSTSTHAQSVDPPRTPWASRAPFTEDCISSVIRVPSPGFENLAR